MIRILLFAAVAAWAQTLPVEIRSGGKDQALIVVRGESIPLIQTGAKWSGDLHFEYQALGPGGTLLKRETATMRIRINAAEHAELLERGLAVPYPLPAGAEKLRVTVTAAAALQTDAVEALVPFQWERKANGLAGDLTAADIALTEDGKPFPAKLFRAGRSGADSVPLEITLLFDCSYSVQSLGALDPEVFGRTILDEFPNVTIGVSGFSDTLMEFTKPTRDYGALQAAARSMGLISPRGTPLFGTIERVIEQMDLSRPAVRLLLVFSDGESSTIADTDAHGGPVGAARKAGVMIYPVQLAAPAGKMSMARMTGEGSLGRTRITARTGEMGRDPMLSAKEFQRLGERTGGKGLARTANRSAVESVLKEIAGQVRSMYVASYGPEEGDKPRERVVRVELNDKAAGRLNGAVRKVVR